jgi:hypothetical protein
MVAERGISVEVRRMKSTAALRPQTDIRINPADAIPLPSKAYSLRGRDGLLICLVGRERAESGIRAGMLELWRGSHGLYLRGVLALHPQCDRRHADGAGSLGMAAPKGAISPDVGNTRHSTSGQVGGLRKLYNFRNRPLRVLAR